MSTQQKIFKVRRKYNQWVNNQTLEDYALRFTAKRARKWSLSRVANTALGAISFLALEAIGAAITISYGFDNTLVATLAVGLIIFLAAIPICYYASKYGVDIDLLTRGAGFGYIGSTITSLIYASFTFIFFALEAAILAMALKLMLGIPLVLGYFISSIVVIPLVTHGITLISRFQLWTQPIWVIFQLLPFIYILYHDATVLTDWNQFEGLHNDNKGSISLIYFGAGTSILFSLIAQIGEQVDFLRFLPEKTPANKYRWWFSLIAAGPGWIIIGVLKILAGSLLAYIALNSGYPEATAANPASMYIIAFQYMTKSPDIALVIGGIFVIVSQLKINVTNAYAGSIAWSNFFSRLTHSHPGRIVWVVFNVFIALMLLELGIYEAFEKTLGIYAIVAVAWVSALVADLVINKPLKLSPPEIEFKRAYLHDINPVGVGSMLLASALGMLCYVGVFGIIAQSLSHFITLLLALLLSPAIAFITGGKYYLAREAHVFTSQKDDIECCICLNNYEKEDMAYCPAYGDAICSLCCSLDARCQDQCKTADSVQEQVIHFVSKKIPDVIPYSINIRFVQFSFLFILGSSIVAILLALIYTTNINVNTHINDLVSHILWRVFLISTIIIGVICWLFVLAHESRIVAQEESKKQNRLAQNEINAHQETDRKLQEAKEQAEAANNAKSRYLSGISHELRTPLNSILGYAQILEKDAEIPLSKQNKISTIRRNGEHLADLIEGLLDISKIEAGRLDIYRNEVNIQALIKELVDMFSSQADKKGLEFSFTYLNKLPEFVAVDEKRLRQILINLLSNAIKFTPQGKVDFTVKYKNQVAEFTIIDSGIGIPNDKLETIFKPFERVRHNNMPAITGTGLGLTITQLFVDVLGGEITVKNNPQGGVTFTVWLMLAGISSPAPAAPARDKILGYAGDPMTIAIVDDQANHRALLKDILHPLGFHTVEAASAEEYLSSTYLKIPDLYLLDISMPGMDGWTLAQTLREQGCLQPIITVSASAGQPKHLAQHVGIVQDCIVKPLHVDTLTDKIGQWLRLTWRYDIQNDLSTYKHHIGPLPLPTLPSTEIINALIYAANIGNISHIKYILNNVDKDQPKYDQFVAMMRNKVLNIQLTDMQSLLREYLNQSDKQHE